jgi:ferrous iron transport protein B
MAPVAIETARPAPADAGAMSVVLVGNPNVGKSVVFSYLTGRYVTVSNYPGTTVEITRGKARGLGPHVEVIDTPGVQSLSPESEDERVTRNVLLSDPNTTVLLVADSKNARRTLTLLVTVLELGRPTVIALNMSDEAKLRGVTFDADAFSGITGIEAIPTVAVEGRGLDRVTKSLLRARRCPEPVRYHSRVEEAIEALSQALPRTNISSRALVLGILTGDQDLAAYVRESVPADFWTTAEHHKQEIRRACGRGPSSVIAGARRTWVEQMATRISHTAERGDESWADKFGHWSMHPLWGVPILVAVLLAVFWFVGIFGAGTAVDFLESTIFGKFLNPWATSLVKLVPWGFFRDLMVGEYGVITMALTYAFAIVLPVVGTFFLAFGALEDSGYLPRLAVMVDRLFRAMGLNGRAVLPMVLGLGCDTMATLTTRVLETKKERVVVTLLLALGVPCSAQMGVILGMLSGLAFSATIIWVGVVLGVLFTVGLLSSKLLKGERSDFILEISPLRWPKIGNIASKTLARMEWYLKEAAPLFVYGTVLLFLMDKASLLPWIERVSAPIIKGLLGLPGEATEAFIVGFLRRDYGAAGLFVLARNGGLDPIQIVTSLITITLFMPCIANFFVVIKEQGLKTAVLMGLFIIPFALLMGGAVNYVLRGVGWTG